MFIVLAIDLMFIPKTLFLQIKFLDELFLMDIFCVVNKKTL